MPYLEYFHRSTLRSDRKLLSYKPNIAISNFEKTEITQQPKQTEAGIDQQLGVLTGDKPDFSHGV